MKKSSKRSSSRRTVKTESSQPSRAPYIWAAVALIAVIALIAVAYYASRSSSNALVTVNGEEIDQETLDFQYNLLPESYRTSFTKEQVLEQVIDETLVVQAAHKAGLNVSNEEVLQRVQGILASNSISITDLQQNLAQYNVTEEQFESLIARQILMERYLNQTLTPTEADEAVLRALYNASLEQYKVPEQVTVRHVLISNQRTDAALIAKSVYDQARNGTDMCKLARNYSDDRGSRDTCGQYTFPRGFMDPVFEGAAFEMSDNDIRLIQTQFGYHVIKRLNITPEGVRPYEAVRDELLTQYQSADRSQQYRKLISTLRASATIVYANGTRIVPEKPAAIDAGDENSIVEPSSQPSGVEPSTEQPSIENATVNETNTTAPSTPVVAPSEPTAPTVEPAPTETTSEPAASTEAIMSCIASKATLYGTAWSSDTQDARDLFASYNLKYVACDDKTACPQIKAYPTWVIGGQQYLGRMTVEQLRNAANC